MKQIRLKKVALNMQQMGIEQLIVSDPLSIFYLTDIYLDPGKRLFALLIKSDASATLFLNRLFPIKEQPGLTTLYHSDGDDAVAMLAEHLADSVLGVDKTWPANFLLKLMEKRHALRPVIGSQAVDNARRYKDAEEIGLMRKASALNDAVMAKAISALKDGITERELAGIISNLHVEHGADSAQSQLVCYGVGSCEPHHEPGFAAVSKGDNVLLDIFAPVNRYWCDMTRTVFYKSASKEQLKVYDAVKSANLAGIAAVRPGATMASIDYAARKVIEEAGYGKFFTHRLGHGIGLDVHEPPDCSSVSTAIAEPGMCFSIEPGIYLPDMWGVRIEDLVVVTEDGVEVFNSYTKEPQIIG